MQEVILIKEGEIALKGLNRRSFEEQLIKNIRLRIKSLGEFDCHRGQSTIVIQPAGNCDIDEMIRRIQTVFGIAAFSRAAVLPKNMDSILSEAGTLLHKELANVTTFKVKAKRSDKHFPLKSPEIERELGHTLLETFGNLKVDVHQPELTVMIEIRDQAAYLYAERLQGAGGIPVGSSGEGMLLLSGGIDSPVAGYRMAKRGMKIHAVHFVSPPYTSDRALQKVERLSEIMARYCGDILFHCVPFTSLQEQMRDECPEELFTVLLRRMMMRVAQSLCDNTNIQALITGESLGQVASQTMQAMVCTDAVCDMPVLRPVIGMDKLEIIETAREIGTYDTSILPYEDCCTIFTPKHPKTRPQLSQICSAEERFDYAPLLQKAVENITVMRKTADWQW